MNINCPICATTARFLGEKRDRFGEFYRYEDCKNCKFIFERGLALNGFDLREKVASLYGGDYFCAMDMGWKLRCDGFLKIIKKIIKANTFFKKRKKISVLDYGGGNGYLSAELARDFNVFYYDKYKKPSINGNYKILNKPQKADIIYAVELVEHFIDISEWDFLKNLLPDIFVFTTGLSDNIKKSEIFSWSYLNPDAGHVAVYSTKSLYLLAKKYGYLYFFFPNISCHIFVKSKFLNKINFVRFEYFVYSILRRFAKK